LSAPIVTTTIAVPLNLFSPFRIYYFTLKTIAMQQREVDVTAVGMQLNELRSKLDRLMREGETFDNVKKVYLQIKELECHLNATHWNPGIPLQHGKDSEPRKNGTRFRHIEDTKPLL
jgi:hypothetical protein